MSFAELKDILPTADGSVRRRLLAGFILVGAAIPVVWRGSAKDFVGASGLENAAISLGALLVIYSVGLLSEIVGETVLLRAFGGVIRGLEFPALRIHAATPAARWLLRGIAFYFVVPAYVLLAGLQELFGWSTYVANIPAGLRTEEAKVQFAKLPAFVRAGLMEPYSNSFDTAFQHLSSKLSVEHQGQVQKLYVRNLETLTVVSSLCLVLLAYLVFGVISVRANLESTLVLQLAGSSWDLSALFLPLSILLPVAALAIHHRYVLSVVSAAVELLALEKKDSAVSELGVRESALGSVSSY